MNTQAARIPASGNVPHRRYPECVVAHIRQLQWPVSVQVDDLWHGPTLDRVTPSRLVLSVAGDVVRYSDRHGTKRACRLVTFKSWARNARLMARAR